MSRRIDTVDFEFVELLPPQLAEGIVYISIENRTIIHLCCSGCGERVVLGLSPAQWRLAFDGETISLEPSIGNGDLACNSHYWIRKNNVVWAKPLTTSQTRTSQRSDLRDAVEHYERAQPKRRAWWRFWDRRK